MFFLFIICLISACFYRTSSRLFVHITQHRHQGTNCSDERIMPLVPRGCAPLWRSMAVQDENELLRTRTPFAVVVRRRMHHLQFQWSRHVAIRSKLAFQESVSLLLVCLLFDIPSRSVEASFGCVLSLLAYRYIKMLMHCSTALYGFNHIK